MHWSENNRKENGSSLNSWIVITQAAVSSWEWLVLTTKEYWLCAIGCIWIFFFNPGIYESRVMLSL